MGTQPTRQPPPGSSERNLFVRVRFGGVPSTVKKVVRDSEYGSVACLVSRSPKAAGHPEAGRSDFRNQRFEPDTAKMRKMRTFPLTPEKQGSEETPRSKNAENAENADTKTAENAADWL